MPLRQAMVILVLKEAQMLTIHGRATSSNVQLVMWAVAELGLPHQRLDVGGAFGQTDTAEFGRMNPNRLVPVLQDGDLTMFESGAILRYLGSVYGPESFWPRDPKVRAPLDQWAEWGKITFAIAMGPLFMGLVRTPPSKRNPEAILSAEVGAAKVARIFDARIGKGPWLTGEALTFADIAMGFYLYRYYTMPFKRSETPNLDAHYARLSARPAFREHVMVSYESLQVID
jgi:glutathione S-transferase